MPEPQAEVLARALSERPGKNSVIEAVQKSADDVNKRIEAVEGRRCRASRRPKNLTFFAV